MKKANITWEVIIKLIITLVVFGVLVILYFLFKERLIDIFKGVIDFIRYNK